MTSCRGPEDVRSWVAAVERRRDPVLPRRQSFPRALFEVLGESGFEKVTLKSVAERAGLAIGSVRHFVGTREELIGFAFDTMADRVQERITEQVRELSETLRHSAIGSDERLEAAVEVLCELLPLDHRRRGEAIVWIEFETAARTDQSLKQRSSRVAAQTPCLVEKILTGAKESGALASSVDLVTETARLSALLDGLTLRGALHPDVLDAELARRALIAHFRGLQQTDTSENR